MDKIGLSNSVFSCRVHAIVGYFWKFEWLLAVNFVFRKREFEIPLRLGVAAAPPMEVLITEVGHLLLGPRVGVWRQLFCSFSSSL